MTHKNVLIAASALVLVCALAISGAHAQREGGNYMPGNGVSRLPQNGWVHKCDWGKWSSAGRAVSLWALLQSDRQAAPVSKGSATNSTEVGLLRRELPAEGRRHLRRQAVSSNLGN
jgi:hypothetical protein